MKTYYLHISYRGIADNEETVLGEALVRASNLSLTQIREHFKEDSKLKRCPVITSLTEISKGLYEMLSDKTEDNEQHREDKSRD